LMAQAEKAASQAQPVRKLCETDSVVKQPKNC
jgi:hypothetical protein